MKILVNFKSGFKQTFIVPKGMLTIDFRNMAREIGGNIESIEFSLPSSRQQKSTNSRARLSESVIRMPDKG